MYSIFTYIYHKNQPNVGKYTIHGCYGIQFERSCVIPVRTEGVLEMKFSRCFGCVGTEKSWGGLRMLEKKLLPGSIASVISSHKTLPTESWLWIVKEKFGLTNCV